MCVKGVTEPMYLQHVIERDGAYMARSATYKLDLPKNGILSSLHLFIGGDEVSGFGSSGGRWRLIDGITRVELLANASTPIKSMTGREAQVQAFWDSGKVAADVWRNYASNTQFASILLNMGRRLNDPYFALDLSRYNSVTLQVTNDLTSSEFSDTLSITVLATYLRDVAAGQIKGYLRTEEYRSWLTVKNAWEYNELPTDLIVRRILLQCDPAHTIANRADTTFTNLADDIRLAIKTRTNDVYRGSASQYMRLNHYMAPGEVMTHGLLYAPADVGLSFDVGYPSGWAGISGSKDGSPSTVVPTIDPGETADTVKPESYEADSPISVFVRGQGYMNTLMVPFDVNPDDPSTWLDPEANKQVTLDVHTRNSDSADNGYNRIVLDRLVP